MKFKTCEECGKFHADVNYGCTSYEAKVSGFIGLQCQQIFFVLAFFGVWFVASAPAAGILRNLWPWLVDHELLHAALGMIATASPFVVVYGIKKLFPKAF